MHSPHFLIFLLFLSGSRKKKLTKRKAADYASVATPVVLPAIRHANLPPHGGGFRQVPHFTPSAPSTLHAPDANVGETLTGGKPCAYAGFRLVRTGRQANPPALAHGRETDDAARA